ncbi:hypothetical protein CUJ83_00165 [Methanocella sp. CWC-04]|uniref:Uncharacterized protein n=1 Tax=Methanooceanicella nereidis TaxID=2052831 RepID=A0AAP2W4M2_9EURY|nr:hypothetical protein [Methanocella sp. CWC-04]MCD1293412.1 hypothetical protein [Methanocella sp. CWC-04]
MEYEMLLLFISFGWFMSVTVIFLMYVRMRQLSEELRKVKDEIELSDDEFHGLERGITDFKKIEI